LREEEEMKSPKKFLTLLLAILLTALAIVTPLSPVLALSITVTMSPSSGPPGTVIYAYGTNCTAGATYTLYFGSSAITSGIVPAGGTVYTYFGAPVMARGSYSVTITTPSDTTTYPATFTITPQVFLDTTSGSAGNQVTVSGNGFYPNSAITIYFDGVAQTPTSTVYSDYYGQFYGATITVPQTYGGAHIITAGDYGGASLGATYSIIPKMTLSASTGAVGSSITVSGTGFASSSTLSFFIDSTAISMSASTNSAGNFSNVAVVIPATYGGAHTLMVQDGSSNSLTADFTVTAAMTIGPTTGPVDTAVGITGNGFLASHAITFTYDGVGVSPTSGSLTSDAGGSFSTNFKVPASSSGSHVITVSDGTNSISANFTVVATASIGPTSGPVATTITASGSGFKGNGKITITYNSVQVGTATANATGSFTTTFTILSASTGSHSMVITDQTNTQTFSFSVTPAATISSTSGYVGSDINVNGTGFGSNKGVTVKYDSDQVTSSTTDASGTFTASFKAPVSKGGDHVIMVTDGTNTTTFKFAMDSTAPPMPTLSLPANLTKLDKIPTLSWTQVTDPSGVTYTLQISKDVAFNNIILHKQGLTTPSYTITKEEKLKSASKSAPYYWRVQAIDAASNESTWSTPQTFLVGLALGDWAIYIVFAVVAVMLGVGGFLLGRLTKRRF
jgi:hypothetical protein